MERAHSNYTGISISICCFNSAARIPETLSHIAKQRIDSNLKLEVLLIDNGSRDDTVKVALECWASLREPFLFKVIHENTPGLSYARRRAITEAKHPFVLFCDDDNWLSSDYIQKSFQFLASEPSIGIVGGIGQPVTESVPPRWFNQYRSSYALDAQASSDGFLPPGRALYGAGMLLRKDPLLSIFQAGFESLLSDRNGDVPSGGGDDEICIWFRLMGFKLFYSSELCFQHFIPSNRLTRNFFLKRSYEKGKTEAVFRLYDGMMSGRNSKWIKNRFYWFFEIVKRCGYWSFYLIQFWSFRAAQRREFLLSSIRYRFLNFYNLQKSNNNIIRLGQWASERSVMEFND